MKPCGKPIGNFSRHAPSKVARIQEMKQEIADNVARAAIFRIHGLLDEMYGYDGVTAWLLSPREGLDFETPWTLICRGEHERILAIVERLAKIGSPL